MFERATLNLVTRTRIAFALAAICFSVLALRLWYLQIVKGDYFRDQSENNRLRQLYVPPPRGLILDREGKVLARNRPSFQVELVREDSPDPEATVRRLAEIVSGDPEEIVSQLRESKGKRRPFEPLVLLKDIDRDKVARVAARRFELPGVVLNVSPAREYLHGSLASHVLGYIGEITSRQLQSPEFGEYRMGDIVGQFGIESRWEKYLQGQRGIQRVIVNATGSKIGEAAFESERAGRNVTLTLDFDAQKAADDALEGRSGAVVAMNPFTGEILALSSAPHFDPNLFVGAVSSKTWKEIVSGPDRPLNNRAVQGTYPPGSVFKIFMSVAMLSEGVMSTKENVHCPGYLQVGSRRFRCHKHSGHGTVNHWSAMVQSCDIFFYLGGQRLGVDRIYEYATRFGLGKPTGINLAVESKGLIPSTEWKKQRYRHLGAEQQTWYPGETPSVAIGQGAVSTTPLQITRGVAALLNGGKLMRPQLIRKISSADGSFLDDDFKPEVVGELGVDPEILKIVRDDLVGVVNDQSGTGRRAQLPKEWGIQVAGKTGTAQVVALELKGKGTKFEHHAWFVGYAPAEDPEIVITAIVENGGGGGAVAAPVVQKVMEAYFSKRFAAETPPEQASTTQSEIREE